MASAAVTPETVIQARVVTVVDRLPGASLVVDAAAGAGELELDNVLDFDEDGGSATIADATQSEVVTFTTLSDDLGTLELSGVLVNSYLGDGETFVYADLLGLEKTALVIRDDVDDEQIEVRVPHRWYDVLPEGARGPGEGEAITARFDGTDWLLEDILGQTPSADASYLDPATLPPPVASDGDPPATSPAPDVQGGIGALFVSWTPIANADPVTYEVHISTSSGFTPDGTTLSQTTDGSQAVIDHLPDGTVLDPSGGTTYYVQIVAVDEDGSASASSEASGFPRQVTGPDIAVEAVTAREILAGSVTADRLAAVLLLASTIQTATEGQRVEISPSGFRLYSSAGDELVAIPTDPGANPTFRGDVVTGGLQVLGNMLIQGADNEMDKGSVLTLQSTLSDPGTAPTLAFGYDSDPLPSPMPDESQIVGLDFDTNGNGSTTDTLLMLGRGLDGNINLYEVSNARPVTLLRSAALFTASNVNGGTDIYGVARCGGYIWVLYKSVVAGNIVLRAFDATTLAGASTTTLALSGDTSQGIALGTDGTKLLIMLWASSSAGADKKVYPYTVSGSTPTQGTPFNLTGGEQRTTTTRLGGITGRDGTHYTTAMRRQSSGVNFTTFEMFLQSTKALDTADGSVWSPDCVTLSTNNEAELWKGVTYDGANHLGVGLLGAIVQRYSAWVWTPAAANDTFWIGYTWAATDPFESAVSPLASLQLNGSSAIGRLSISSPVAMRGQLVISTPPLPSVDVDSASIYELPSASAPATSSMHKQTPDATVIGAFGNQYIRRGYSAAGAAPDTAHPFPGATSTITGEGVGLTAPWELGGDGSFLLSRQTVAQRPGSPVEGDLRYNEDRSIPEFYDGSGWRGATVEHRSVSVNVPSTAASTSGLIQPTISGLLIGDLCFWIGCDTNDGIQFHFRTDTVCSTNGQINLRYFNADTATRDPAATNHHFLIVRLT